MIVDIEAGEGLDRRMIFAQTRLLIGGAAAIGLISALSLPWPAASEFIVAEATRARHATSPDDGARRSPRRGFVRRASQSNLDWRSSIAVA